MPPARSFHRFSNCDIEVQHVGDDLEIGLHLGIRPRRTANRIKRRFPFSCLNTITGPPVVAYALPSSQAVG